MYLVEIIKPFAIYPRKAQIVMRKSLANGIFKDNIKVLKKDVNIDTEVKYELEVKVEEKKEAPKKIEEKKEVKKDKKK